MLLTVYWIQYSSIVAKNGVLTSNDQRIEDQMINWSIEHWLGCRATEPGFAGDMAEYRLNLITAHCIQVYQSIYLSIYLSI